MTRRATRSRPCGPQASAAATVGLAVATASGSGWRSPTARRWRSTRPIRPASSPHRGRRSGRAGCGGRSDTAAALVARRRAGRDVLGRRRRPPAAVRRVARRPGAGVGRRPRPGADTIPVAAPARPVHPARDPSEPDGAGRRRRPPAPGVGRRRVGDVADRLARWAALARRRGRPPAGAGSTRCPTARGRRRRPARSRRPSCCAPSWPPTACRWTARRPSASSPASSGRGRGRAAEPAAQRARARRRGAAPRPAGRASTCAARPRCGRCCGAVGVEVPDTRAWRLERARDEHPLVDALLAWRKAERVATTYGYAWLDEHLGADGRLRGRWSGSDGAAGPDDRVGGLHNMPADMRAAVVAEPGHVFVRADLGQIEPRVLAAVSGDARAGRGDARRRHVRAGRRAARRRPGRRPRSPCSGRCTARPPATAPRRCAGWRRRTRWRWRYLADADVAGQVGRDLRTTAAGWCGWARRTPTRSASAMPAGGPRRGVATGATRWCRARRPSCSRCGRSRCGPRRRARRPRSCCACTTSCSCTPRPSAADAVGRAGRRLPAGGRPPLGARRRGPVRRRRQRRSRAGPTPSRDRSPRDARRSRACGSQPWGRARGRHGRAAAVPGRGCCTGSALRGEFDVLVPECQHTRQPLSFHGHGHWDQAPMKLRHRRGRERRRGQCYKKVGARANAGSSSSTLGMAEQASVEQAHPDLAAGGCSIEDPALASATRQIWDLDAVRRRGPADVLDDHDVAGDGTCRRAPSPQPCRPPRR